MTAPTALTKQQTETRDAFFTRVVREHARVLYRVAFSLLRHPEDAEDAVSDALLKLLRSGAWQTVSNERAFLARTVWRASLDRMAGRLPAAEGGAETLEELQDLQPSPEGNAAAEQERNRLHSLIERLPEELRGPLLLSAVEELNSREIGEVLHLPEGTVRTRQMRARQQLRAWYEAMEREDRGREVAARGATW